MRYLRSDVRRAARLLTQNQRELVWEMFQNETNKLPMVKTNEAIMRDLREKGIVEFVATDKNAREVFRLTFLGHLIGQHFAN